MSEHQKKFSTERPPIADELCLVGNDSVPLHLREDSPALTSGSGMQNAVKSNSPVLEDPLFFFVFFYISWNIEIKIECLVGRDDYLRVARSAASEKG